MKRLLRATVVACVLAVPVFAIQDAPQSQPSPQPQASPQPETAPQPQASPQVPEQQPVTSPSPAAAKPIPSLNGFGLEDGTPVKLRLTRNLSSASDRKGDTVDFEVVEDVTVDGVVVIPRDGIAWATITEAQPKRRMGRGGKLDVNIDAVRLKDGEKVALRAVREDKGGGHVGAMTGAMVATGIVFFPAAPLFLFMHGKDINIPKGTEITAYVAGNVPLAKAKFLEGSETPQATLVPASTSGLTSMNVSSVPGNADIEVDGKFVGNTPSSISLSPGDHTIRIAKKGYKPWERKLAASGGTATVNAELEEEK